MGEDREKQEVNRITEPHRQYFAFSSTFPSPNKRALPNRTEMVHEPSGTAVKGQEALFQFMVTTGNSPRAEVPLRKGVEPG
jgi:hypothetical protein